MSYEVPDNRQISKIIGFWHKLLHSILTKEEFSARHSFTQGFDRLRLGGQHKFSCL
jgi:hypothetical protein